MRSPAFTNSGTWTTAPVSSVAGFVTLDTVSPRTPGLGLRDSELHGRGQLNAGRLSVHGQHLHGARRLDERKVLLEVPAWQVNLLVRLLVHEDDLRAGVVEVLGRPSPPCGCG